MTTGMASREEATNSFGPLAATTTPMMSRMATWETIGSATVIFSIFSLKTAWQITPRAIGKSTTLTALRNNDSTGTVTYWEASHCISSGIMNGAHNVDRMPMDTSKATSPRLK